MIRGCFTYTAEVLICAADDVLCDLLDVELSAVVSLVNTVGTTVCPVCRT